MLTHEMTIAGLKRALPICRVNDNLYIGAFVIFGDCELTMACATELLKKAPEYDYLITAESKGIPLAYNKDMQEDKELVFDAIDTTKGCLALFTGMLRTMKFNDARMEESAKHGFTNATDAADYLVNHGMPFRDAHGIVGQLVLYGIEHKKALDDFTMEEFKAISPVFEEDIYDAISMKTCVEMRNTIGAPGPEAMKKVIALHEAYLEEC